MQNQKWSFADLQRYIYQNNFLFATTTETNENNEEITEKICKELKETLKNQEVKVCNASKIEIDLLRKSKIVTMSISHENFVLNNIDISDENAKIQLHAYLQNPDIQSQLTYNKITKDEFVLFVQKTIDGFLSFVPESGDFEGSTNTMIIIERVKKYLGIQVNDIVEKDNKILLDFTIAGIPFLGSYNMQEHKISPLYFKEANDTKTPVLIKNVSIPLSDDAKSFLNIFSLQPLEVIKQYSPEEYLLYQKFISEKK